MKIKIKHLIVTLIDWINSIQIWQDTSIGNRYSTKYFIYLGEATLERESINKKIAYSGLVSDAPVIYHTILINDIEAGNTDDYVIIFDNWK